MVGREKWMKFLAVLGLFFCCVFTLQAASDPEIQRVISWRENHVREDRLQFDETLAQRQHELWQLFYKCQQGSTNLETEVRALLADDDLEMLAYSFQFNNGALDLKITSKAAPKTGAASAKIKWLPSFGGITLTFGAGSWNEAKAKMNIYVGRTAAILHFPRIGDAFSSIPHLEMLPELTKRDEAKYRLQCIIHTDNRTEDLFLWQVPEVSGPATEHEVIRKAYAKHGMSDNDLFRLCTNMKVGRSGFYQLSSKP